MRRRVSSRRPVRLASKRYRKRSRVGAQYSERFLPILRSLTRENVFLFYVIIVLAPFCLVLAGHIALYAHDEAIPVLLMGLWEELTSGAVAVSRRPSLIFSYLLVLSLLWCMPWSKILDFLSDESNSGDQKFRRGRQLRTLSEAAEIARARRTNRKRRQR